VEAVESLDHCRVADVLLFVCEERTLVTDRCHSRDALTANRIDASIQILAVSKIQGIHRESRSFAKMLAETLSDTRLFIFANFEAGS
jgi:hypothetical protein